MPPFNDGVLLFYINDIGFKVFQIMGRNICDLPDPGVYEFLFDDREYIPEDQETVL